MNKLQGNKLISLYMNETIDLKQWGPNWERLIKETNNISEIPPYDKSWDWMMPVVDDIYYGRRFNTGACSSEISSKPYKLYAKIKVALLNLSIDQLHTAVVNFIQWYISK